MLNHHFIKQPNGDQMQTKWNTAGTMKVKGKKRGYLSFRTKIGCTVDMRMLKKPSIWVLDEGWSPFALTDKFPLQEKCLKLLKNMINRKYLSTKHLSNGPESEINEKLLCKTPEMLLILGRCCQIQLAIVLG